MTGLGNGETTAADHAMVADHFTGLQLRAALFCFLLFVVDGADVLVVSYAAPALAADWALSPDRLGIVFSAGLAGMTLGALVLAPQSDRYGRKTLILVALALVGLAMIASGFAGSINRLILLRFAAGLGIGSMLASITALGAEFAPPRHRAFLVTFATGGYPVGAILSGIAATYVIPAWGWRGLFVGAGVVSLILFPLALVLLPESLSFLAERRPRRALERINRMRAAMRLPALETLVAGTGEAARAGVSALLAPRRRTITVMIWGTFFFTFLTLYFLTSWIPKIAADAGLSPGQAIYAGAAFNFGALLGVILLGWLASRLSLSRTIAWFFAGAPLAMLAFAYFHEPLSLLFVELVVMGFFIQGGFGGLYAVAARAYPTAIRTTGVGWGLGAGRFGAIFGPLLGGLVLGAGATLQTTFLIFALPMIVAGLLIWRLGDATPVEAHSS